jgi:azurin
MSRHTLLPATLLLGAVAAAACGTATPPASNGEATPAAPTASTAPAPAVHDGRKVEITANDAMKFSVVEIAAKPGERLSVTLANTGSTPKFSMGHNWVLLVTAANVDAFLVSAAEAATTEYVPASKRAEILTSTKLLGPGERDTVTFAAPSAPGRYPFLCSFPGHAQVGMRGVLIVQ